MYEKRSTQSRLPQLADREDIPEDQKELYDRLLELQGGAMGLEEPTHVRPLVDGIPYANSYYRALSNAPRAFAGLLRGSRSVMESQDGPGSFTGSDHEWVDLIHGFDSGYWALHAGHTGHALATGISVDALLAVHEGREEDLDEDDRLVIAFARAVRDLKMTDDLWARMIERIGTLRGTIELAYFSMAMWAHVAMHHALGVAAIEETDWVRMVSELGTGELNVEDYTVPYIDPAYPWPSP